MRAADVVHLHSNWTFPVLRSSEGAFEEDKFFVFSPYVGSPHLYEPASAL